MPNSKFMVIKLRELLKTIAFAILGVIVIMFFIYFMAGKFSDATALYNPGVYSSNIQIDQGEAVVEVKVDKRKIVAVDIVDKTNSLPVFYPLFSTVGEEVAEKVVDEQTVEIKMTDNYGITAELVLAAVEDSLEKAKK